MNHETCTWTENDDCGEEGHWYSSCGMEFWFVEQDELTWKYCPKCGKPLTAVHANFDIDEGDKEMDAVLVPNAKVRGARDD